jgi:hypothetical protein
MEETWQRLQRLSTRILEPPTREQSSPAECLSWLIHHTGEEGPTAGAEALIAAVKVIEQPGHRQQDSFDAIHAVADRHGASWDGLNGN